MQGNEDADRAAKEATGWRERGATGPRAETPAEVYSLRSTRKTWTHKEAYKAWAARWAAEKRGRTSYHCTPKPTKKVLRLRDGLSTRQSAKSWPCFSHVRVHWRSRPCESSDNLRIVGDSAAVAVVARLCCNAGTVVSLAITGCITFLAFVAMGGHALFWIHQASRLDRKAPGSSGWLEKAHDGFARKSI